MGGCFTGETTVWTPEGPLEIEDVEVGQRVITDFEQPACSSDVDESWSLLTLEMTPPDGLGTVIIETLKSADWVAEHGAEVGAVVWFDLEELGLKGLAHVIEARGPPAVEEGIGCVVLSTFERESNQLRQVTLASGQVLRVAESHRLYSETHDRWMAVGNLHEGDYLRTADSTEPIAVIEAEAGVTTVFNLEVEGEHRYLVGPDGVLAHNNGSSNCGGGSWPPTLADAKGWDAAVRKVGGGKRHADFQGPLRPAPSDNTDWGRYLERRTGASKPTLPGVSRRQTHAHHVLVRHGPEAVQAEVAQARQILFRREALIRTGTSTTSSGQRTAVATTRSRQFWG